MKRAENLVFFPDSPFATWIIDRCEKLFPGLNDYVSFGERVTNFSTDQVRLVGLNLSSLKSFSRELGKYNRIIIHYHNEITGYLIELAQVPSHKIIWMLWSGDLYNCPFYRGEVYLPLTYGTGDITLFKPLPLKLKLKEKVKEYLKRPGYYLYKRSFARIQTVGSFFPKDVQNAKDTFGVDFTHIFHGIVSVTEQLHNSVKEGLPILGDSILLGHAGVPELNHLDIIQRMGSFFGDKKIICPLAYGNPSYIEKVKTSGVAQFGDRFEALLDYMPREEYYQKLQKGSFAIFGAVIHQGFGNIMTLLYLGFKVFLFSWNPVYAQLKYLGLLLFPLENVDQNSFSVPLSQEEKVLNRKILDEVLSEQRIDNYYREVYLNPVIA